MLHLQLDGVLMNGARQEHYMFDPGFSWPLSSSVKSVRRKVSVCRVPVVMETLEKLQSGKCFSGLE